MDNKEIEIQLEDNVEESTAIEESNIIEESESNIMKESNEVEEYESNIVEEFKSDEENDLTVDVNELLKEESNSVKHKILKAIIPLIMTFGLISLIYGLYNIGAHIINSLNSKMSTSHVYVCDDPNNKSDFDNWLSNDLELSWVPTYLVIKNNQVVGAFPGDIPEDTFMSNLTMCILADSTIENLPNTSITNIDGDTKYLSEIFKNTNDIYILEILWIDCDDCKHQDDYYTDEIYSSISTSNVYRYYIKSDINKVIDKFK